MKERFVRGFTSLTAKYVAVFVLLVAVPSVAVAAYTLSSSYDREKADLAQLQEERAKALAGSFGQSLTNIFGQLSAIHGAGVSESRLRATLQPLVSNANATGPFYIDSHGRMRASESAFQYPRALFRQARATGTYVGSLEPDLGGQGAAAEVAAAENSGKGVVGEALSISGQFADILEAANLNPSLSAYMTDPRGRPIGANPNAGLLARASDFATSTLTDMPQVRTGLRSEAGWMIGKSVFDGRPVVSAWATVRPLGWKVFVDEPESIAFAAVRGTLWRTILIVLGFLLAAVALSILLARRLVRPIKRLQVAAEAIGAGAYDERIELGRRDELGALAGAFNVMAARVQELIGGLERTVAERTKQLERASKHKSEFLANMSHELRTPLNAILGFTQVLQQKLFGEVNDKQEEYLGDIHSSADHLLELINDVLDLSKVEAGQVELEKAHFSLREALERGVVMVRERAVKNGVQLTLEPNPEVDFVTADERRIRQVVFNLLSNAVKFTPQGGSIEVSSAQRNGEVLVSVADTGPGIAPEDLERIFEEFQQADIGSEQPEGTGLGLALSKKLIELHGGRIWVESQPGHGSTFTFTLPVEPTA